MILTHIQKLSLILTLAILLTFTWCNLAHADGPGDLDTSFGNAGVVTTSVTSGNDGGYSMIIQLDGKIVVAGYSAADVPGVQHHFTLTRYDADGNLDADFKSSGVVTTEIDHKSLAYSVASYSDGKFIVAGYSQTEGGSDASFTVARYTISGTLDTDFNNTGIVTTSLGYPFNIGRAVAVQPDGKIVVGGQVVPASGIIGNIGLVRYTITGSLDTEFNETGIVTTSIGDWDDVSPDHSIAIQPDGKILVAGGFTGASSAGYIARYTITGSLDTSFNSTGIVTETGSPYINVLALQPDGKIVATGSSAFALIRYNSNGTLDNSFNGTGIITPPLIAIRAVTLQPNGKIVIGGGLGDNFALVRYDQDGTLDTTFGNNGIITTTITSNEDTINSLAVQPDGKIVTAGWANVGTGDSYFAVVRYLGDERVLLPIILKQ